MMHWFHRTHWLSRYLDGEIRPAEARFVEKRLERCGRCRLEFGRIKQAAELLGMLPRVGVPRDVPSLQPLPLSRRLWHRTMTAATVFSVLVAGVMTWLYWPRVRQDAPENAFAVKVPQPNLPKPLDISEYVQDLEEGQHRFYQSYPVRPVDPQLAKDSVGFAVFIPATLPEDFMLEETKVLQIDCCRTLQLNYRKGDRQVSVFQESPHHPVDLGVGDIETIQVDGVYCHRRREGTYMMAYWETGKQNIALVGELSESELTNLVRYFSTALKP
jgi:anti-sigma factor RsiW